MGQQLNKTIKRNRRIKYLKRKKETAAAKTVAAKAKKAWRFMFEQDHSQSGLFLYLCLTRPPSIVVWFFSGLRVVYGNLICFTVLAEEMENLSRKEWALNSSNDS